MEDENIPAHNGEGEPEAVQGGDVAWGGPGPLLTWRLCAWAGCWSWGACAAQGHWGCPSWQPMKGSQGALETEVRETPGSEDLG